MTASIGESGKITDCNYRNLLTHTSGLSYTKFGDLSLPLLQRCLAPLVFEPGQGFIYGSKWNFAMLAVFIKDMIQPEQISPGSW